MVIASMFNQSAAPIRKIYISNRHGGVLAAGHLDATMEVYEWTISYFLCRKEGSSIRWTATPVGIHSTSPFKLPVTRVKGAVQIAIRIFKATGVFGDFLLTPHSNLPGSPSEGLLGYCIPLEVILYCKAIPVTTPTINSLSFFVFHHSPGTNPVEFAGCVPICRFGRMVGLQ